MNRELIIAIDGPSGAGKSTLSRLLARSLGYVTSIPAPCTAPWPWRPAGGGSIRETTGARPAVRADRISASSRDGAGERVLLERRGCLRSHPNPGDQPADLPGFGLPRGSRGHGSAAAAVGAGGGVVLEGRDIGTVVFPECGCQILSGRHRPGTGEKALRGIAGQGPGGRSGADDRRGGSPGSRPILRVGTRRWNRRPTPCPSIPPT